MPNNLIRRIAQPGAQLDRRQAAELAEAQLPGLRTAAHLHAAGLAGLAGLHNAAMLSKAAEGAYADSPFGETEYRAIVAAYGSVAAIEIQRLAFRGK